MKHKLYFLAVIACAAAGLWWTFQQVPPPDYRLVLVLGALCFLVEWYAIQTPSGGTASLSISIAYAAILLGGPLLAALTALPTAVSRQDIEAKKPLLNMGFNAAQLVVTTLVAGWLFLAIGGTPLLGTDVAQVSVSSWLLPAMAIIPVKIGANWLLFALALAMMYDMSFKQTWALTARSYIAGLGAPFLLGLVFAQLVSVGGYLSIVLLVAPFLVAKQTFRVYQDQADAYRDTLRSLISALEAKDTYTHGHSERVARYARGIAEEMGLAESEVTEIEQAALLHDIGKISISTQILRKPAALSNSEYKLIQTHPGLAAETLANIEFLESMIPMISGHHERLDGEGYPKGLRGDEIALGARILAVADCFDAMTSDRPYRRAMNSRQAVRNLTDAVGTQLDPDCVTAFLRWAQEIKMVDAEAVEQA